MKKYHVVQLVLIILLVALSFVFYPSLPQRVAVHFDFKGEPNTFMNKDIAIVIIPIVALYIFLLGILVKKVPQFYLTLIVCLLIVSQMFFLILMNMGYEWSFAPGLGILIIGVLIGEYYILRQVVAKKLDK